jgi:type I restriction enzyme S subunit
MEKSLKPELRFSELRFSEFTDEWKNQKLGSFLEIKSGHTFSPKYQGRRNEKWLYIKVADIGKKNVIKYLKTAINSVSNEIMNEMNAKPFRAGCTVFPRVGAALLNNNKRLLYRDSLIDDNVLAVNIFDLKKCDDEFFFYWFLTKHLSEFCNNGLVPVISAKRVKTYSIPVPNLPEQKKNRQLPHRHR